MVYSSGTQFFYIRMFDPHAEGLLSAKSGRSEIAILGIETIILELFLSGQCDVLHAMHKEQATGPVVV